MEPFSLKNEPYFLINDWFKGAVAGFTTKNGGKSNGDFESLNLGFHVKDNSADVIENRKIVSELLGLPLACWVGAEQTHETNIIKIEHGHKGKGAMDYQDSFKATDGFFTKEPGILLALCYADCVPLYFYAPEVPAIGMAHAGWKGSVAGIGRKMVLTFSEEGINPEDILVVIGPSICENCYIVDDRVISDVENILENVEEKPYNQISHNQYRLNLKELNSQILIQAGIRPENIGVSKLCTSCDQDYFFSHRRDKGKTGRMIGFISLRRINNRPNAGIRKFINHRKTNCGSMHES